MLFFCYSHSAGSPAQTVGWRDPGFIHTSFLKSLWPNLVYAFRNLFIFITQSRVCSIAFFHTFFRYTYRLGHLLSTGSYIWSKKYSFKSSPYPGQDSLQRVVIFGDMGKVRIFTKYLNILTPIGCSSIHI
jgi:hypothetical protein